MPAFCFSLPISCAALARWFNSSTSFRSSSSICLRQSAISIPSLLACYHLRQLDVAPNHCLHELCHSRGFFSVIAFDDFDNGTADDHAIGELADAFELSRSRDAEPDRYRKFRKLAQALHQLLRIFGHLLARAGYPGARDGIDESARNLRDLLESRIGTGGRGQKNRGQIIPSHLAQIFAGFFHRKIGDQRAVETSSTCNPAEFTHAHFYDRI